MEEIQKHRINYKTRIDILKDIHRKKIIEKESSSFEQICKQTQLTKECKRCGDEFLPKVNREEYCPKCNPERDTPSNLIRAKEWLPILKKEFKNNRFLKEDVSKIFNHKYSYGIVLKVLFALSRQGLLKINKKSNTSCNVYCFSKEQNLKK